MARPIVNGNRFVGKWVEYRDNDGAQRAGKITQYYGGRLTVILRWKKHILWKERISVDRILRVKEGRRWIEAHPTSRALIPHD